MIRLLRRLLGVCSPAEEWRRAGEQAIELLDQLAPGGDVPVVLVGGPAGGYRLYVNRGPDARPPAVLDVAVVAQPQSIDVDEALDRVDLDPAWTRARYVLQPCDDLAPDALGRFETTPYVYRWAP